jgi:hypothetical protein
VAANKTFKHQLAVIGEKNRKGKQKKRKKKKKLLPHYPYVYL